MTGAQRGCAKPRARGSARGQTPLPKLKENENSPIAIRKVCFFWLNPPTIQNFNASSYFKILMPTDSNKNWRFWKCRLFRPLQISKYHQNKTRFHIQFWGECVLQLLLCSGAQRLWNSNPGNHGGGVERERGLPCASSCKQRAQTA